MSSQVDNASQALDLLHRRITNYASVAQDHEGFAALATVRRVLSEQETENERLRGELAEADWIYDEAEQRVTAMEGRAVAAEAEVERYREGLREALAALDDKAILWIEAARILRALLAGEPDEGGAK